MDGMMNHMTPPNTANDSEYPSLLSHSAGWIVVIIALLSGVIALVTYLPSQVTAAPADPFAAYADVMPGASRADVLNAGFICDTRQPDYCSRLVNDIHFTSVSITCAEDRVAQTQFMIRDGMLRIGDLPYFTEEPAARFTQHSVRFSWGSVHASAQTDNRQFSYFTSLMSITFTASPLPVSVAAAF
jgi:hypothetical protein